MHKFIDLSEQRFGKLTVLKRAENSKNGLVRLLCRCDCGKEKIVQYGNLKNGHTQSCGCLNIEKIIQRSTKHGHYNDKTYQSWKSIIQRCTNQSYNYWKDYGGRGITVCKRWSGKNGFIHFLEDMGERPRGKSIDRKNNNKNYCKSNCRWATRSQQQRNKRNNCYVTYEGKRWLLVELCEEFNMPYRLVYNRYYNGDWTLEDALITPVKKRKKRKTNG